MIALEARDDEQLIERFLLGARDEAELAFAAIVERHRPAVMGFCRRVLLQREDAEDAVQATFIALARNAGRIRDRRVLASWLHGVALRVAIKIKARSARRREVHRQAGESPAPRRPEDIVTSDELRRIVHDEVHHLPEDYRIVVVYSYLEGRSNQQVARILGWPIGTVKGRLWRARGMLRERLCRRVGAGVD
jgi:RNA polymerase sigma factor (sigma-70 family)